MYSVTFFRFLMLMIISIFFFSCEDSISSDTTSTTSDPTSAQSTVSEGTPPETSAKTVILERFKGICSGMNDGCSCAYAPKGKDIYSVTIFSTDMGANACMKINGEMVSLKSKAAEYRMRLQRCVDYAKNNQNWITLYGDQPISYFGAPMPEGLSYEEQVEYLSHILLFIPDLPTEVPISNKATGMAIREVRDQVAEAVAITKKRIANADYQLLEQDIFYNSVYQVIEETKAITEYEGEANEYEGNLIIKDAKGNVLLTQPVKGTCGC